MKVWRPFPNHGDRRYLTFKIFRWKTMLSNRNWKSRRELRAFFSQVSAKWQNIRKRYSFYRFALDRGILNASMYSRQFRSWRATNWCRVRPKRLASLKPRAWPISSICTLINYATSSSKLYKKWARTHRLTLLPSKLYHRTIISSSWKTVFTTPCICKACWMRLISR
jgi:hypothetical protein